MITIFLPKGKLAETRQEAATIAIKPYNKEYRDARLRKPTIYREGDRVLVRDTQNKPGESAKFKTKYKGPYQIVKSLGNNHYVVQDIPGFNLTAMLYDTILSSDRIKPWVKLSESADENYWNISRKKSRFKCSNKVLSFDSLFFPFFCFPRSLM